MPEEEWIQRTERLQETYEPRGRRQWTVDVGNIRAETYGEQVKVQPLSQPVTYPVAQFM